MAEEEITLNFSYNQEKESIHCHIKDKIENMFEVFCKIKQIDLNSVYFLCGGDQIKNQEQTFEQLGKKTNVFSLENNVFYFHFGFGEFCGDYSPYHVL